MHLLLHNIRQTSQGFQGQNILNTAIFNIETLKFSGKQISNLHFLTLQNTSTSLWKWKSELVNHAEKTNVRHQI